MPTRLFIKNAVRQPRRARSFARLSKTPQCGASVCREKAWEAGWYLFCQRITRYYSEGGKRPTDEITSGPIKQVDSITKITDNRFEEIRLEWQQIARSEVSRQQRKSTFTAEQRREVESALVAVTDGLFERLLGNVSSTAQLTCLKIWRRDEVVVS